jgi:hypothetical protein
MDRRSILPRNKAVVTRLSSERLNLMDALRQSLQAGNVTTSAKHPTRHAARATPKRRQRKAA